MFAEPVYSSKENTQRVLTWAGDCLSLLVWTPAWLPLGKCWLSSLGHQLSISGTDTRLLLCPAGSHTATQSFWYTQSFGFHCKETSFPLSQATISFFYISCFSPNFSQEKTPWRFHSDYKLLQPRSLATCEQMSEYTVRCGYFVLKSTRNSRIKSSRSSNLGAYS